tara:strand:+ start:624 stop:776 length:153 start_codon:yes stop_codon:yes gene_type:complete
MQLDCESLSEELQAQIAHQGFSESAYWDQEEAEREHVLKLQELEQELDFE